MRDLKGKIESLRDDFDEAAEQLQDLKALQDLRNVFLSRKKGRLTRLITEIRNLAPADKKEAGLLVNSFKQYVRRVLALREEQLDPDPEEGLKADLTLPGFVPYWGAPHPIIQLIRKTEGIFLKMGFASHQGPEIERDYYNFSGLNYPRYHAARSVKETLYINDNHLMRTHLASVYIRVMEKQRPPLRMITSGKVFRNHTTGETASPIRFQLGGLVVDLGINFSHLKGLVDGFLRTLFNDRIQLRFLPRFFPYTEPGVGIDMDCPHCGGDKINCSSCQGTGWTAVMSAGMIGPHIFKNVNIDPEKFAGFAFGLEVDRIARLLSAGNESRNYYENDLSLVRTLPRIT
jgi:phenylalanyl-tRNA synthetase alpha chain